jgi:hypothetical protein
MSAIRQALGLIYSTGYVVGAWLLGRQLMKPPASRVLAFLAGLAILRALALVPILAGIVGAVATVFGLGALMVAAWRGGRPVRVRTEAEIRGPERASETSPPLVGAGRGGQISLQTSAPTCAGLP